MDKTRIKFSVIIPCYNLEGIVSNTINSVLQQTYKQFEVIAVDDGSTDNTLQELQLLKKKDSRIKVYSKKNGGVSSARNYGISRARGEYLYFLDGDDRIHNYLLEKAFNVLKDNNIDMYSFGFMKVDSTGKKIKTYTKNTYNECTIAGLEFLEKHLYKQVTQNICSCIISKELIERNNISFIEGTKYAEDIEFIIKVMSKSNLVYYNSKEMFYYYYREGSAVNRTIDMDNFDVYIRIQEYLKDINIKATCQYICYWFVSFYMNILKKGSNSETVRKYLEFEYVLKNYKFRFDIYSFITFIFIILYKPVFKKYLIKKYKLEKRV